MHSNRVTLFAHFDGDYRVKPYVTEYLGRLRQVSPRIVFVSTSRLGEPELDKVRPHVEKVLVRDNAGYDIKVILLRDNPGDVPLRGCVRSA